MKMDRKYLINLRLLFQGRSYLYLIRYTTLLILKNKSKLLYKVHIEICSYETIIL